MTQRRIVSRRPEIRLVAAMLVTPVAAGALMFVSYMGLWYGGLQVFDIPAEPVDGAIGLALGSL